MLKEGGRVRLKPDGMCKRNRVHICKDTEVAVHCWSQFFLSKSHKCKWLVKVGASKGVIRVA